MPVGVGASGGGGAVAADLAGVLAEGDIAAPVHGVSTVQWPRAQEAISAAVACSAGRSVIA